MTYRIPRVILFLLIIITSGYTAAAQRDTVLYPVTSGSMTGYMHRSGKLIVGYIYNSGEYFKDGYAMVRNQRAYGAIDATGATVVPLVYERLQYLPEEQWWIGKLFSDSIRIFKPGASKDIYYGPGNNATSYCDIKRIAVASSQHRSPYYCYLLDDHGRRIAERRGGAMVAFNGIEREGMPGHYNRYGLTYSHDNTTAVTDLNGNILFDSVRFLEAANGLIPLFGEKRAAVIDTQLHVVIPFSAGYHSFGRMAKVPYFFAQKDTLSGIVDFHGAVVVPCTFKGQLFQNNEHFFEIYNYSADPHYAVYNSRGEQIITSYDPVDLNNERIYGTRMPVVIQKNDTAYQLWDGAYLGKLYPFIANFGFDGYAVFISGKTKGLLDRHGAEVLTTQYDLLSYPVAGIMAAGERIECPACDKYPCAQEGADGRHSWVNQYFYIDMNGHRLSRETYDFLLPYADGQAQVSKNCHTYFINQAGDSIAGGDGYAFITSFAYSVRVVQNKAGQQVLMNGKGSIISEWVDAFTLKEGSTNSFRVFGGFGFKGEAISIGTLMALDFTDGLVKFRQHDKYGMIDSFGHTGGAGHIQQHQHRMASPVCDQGRRRAGAQGHTGADGQVLIAPVYYQINPRCCHGRAAKEQGRSDHLICVLAALRIWVDAERSVTIALNRNISFEMPG